MSRPIGGGGAFPGRSPRLAGMVHVPSANAGGSAGSASSSLLRGGARETQHTPMRSTSQPPLGGNKLAVTNYPLEEKGTDGRLVLESRPVKAERVLYRLPKHYCPRCRHTFRPRTPAVLPKSLYGHQLVATASTMHYLHGIPLGRVCEQTGLGPGSLVEIFHRVARLCAGVPEQLVAEYRQAPVKHAEETGWRTNGKNGYAWLFATPQLSVFLFRKTRAASVPKEVFGKG